MQTTRRAALKRIAIGTSALSLAGTAAADVGSQSGDAQRFLVRLDDAGDGRRLQRSGFLLADEFAGGSVCSVVGAVESASAIESLAGVDAAVPDVRFDPVTPELEEPHDYEPEAGGSGAGGSGAGGSDADGAQQAAAEPPELFDQQWDKHLTDVRAAHETATGEGATVAIIDSGVDEDHVDLGNFDDEHSTAIVEGEHREHVGDSLGHGTHVAGIAAATGSTGVLGTAPDADLVSVRVGRMEDARLLFSDVLLAIEYAAEIGADAANLSLGTPPLPPQANAEQYRRVMTPVVQEAVREGTVVVAAAGNDDTDLQRGGTVMFPSSLAGTVSVSATGPNDERSFYSNYGTSAIDVGAPGGGYETIETSLVGDDVEWPFPTNFVLSTLPGDAYGYAAGTSMAAPQVAGAAALARSVAPEANAHQVQRAIEQGADLVRGSSDPDLGAGRLNAADAVDQAR